MEMSEKDIVKNYRESKDKNQQVRILADMNLCEPREILNILSNNNAISGIRPQNKKAPALQKRFKWTDELVNTLINFINEGLSYSQAAERMGLDVSQIRNKLHGLKVQGVFLNDKLQHSTTTQSEESESVKSMMLNIKQILMDLDNTIVRMADVFEIIENNISASYDSSVSGYGIVANMARNECNQACNMLEEKIHSLFD